MAIHYGFGRRRRYSSDVDEYWTKKYEDLNEGEQKFYHQLPLIMSCVGIGHVSEETIPEIMFRARALALWQDTGMTTKGQARIKKLLTKKMSDN